MVPYYCINKLIVRLICYFFWQVVDGLRIGNDALKKANAVFNIDEIERIMDETREGVEKQRVSLFPFPSLTSFHIQFIYAFLSSFFFTPSRR